MVRLPKTSTTVTWARQPVGVFSGFGIGQPQRVGDGRPQVRQRDAVGEVGSHRGEDIAPVEGAADLRQEVLLVRQVDDLDRPAVLFGILEHGREQAVIRTDKIMRAQAGGQRTAPGADPGVNDRHVHRAGREERIGAPEGKGAFEHVLRGDGVADIGDLRSRANAPDDAFQGADKAVFEAEVSGEGEGGHGGEEVESRSDQEGMKDLLGCVPIPLYMLVAQVHV